MTAAVIGAPGAVAAAWNPKTRTRRNKIAAGTLAVLIVLVGVLFTSSTPAHAWFGIDNPLCGQDNIAPQVVYGVGADSLVPDPVVNGSRTLYSQYGTGGTTWTAWDVCVGDLAMNGVANFIFSAARMTDRVIIGLFRWAADGKTFETFTKKGGPLDQVVGKTGNNLFNSTTGLLLPIIVLGALYGAWTGLVKKRSTETMQGWLWMVGCAAFALWFFAQPSFIARTGDKFVGDTAGLLTSATVATPNAGGDSCVTSSAGVKDGGAVVANSLYCAFVFSPWAIGQFGPKGQANIPYEGKDLRVYQLSLAVATAGNSVTDTGEKWERLAGDLKDKDPYKGTVYPSWQGKDVSARFSVATGALLATLVGGVVIGVISFSTVVLHLVMLLLLFAAPLFLLVGVHPGWGRKVALKWLEMLLGTFLKRIVLGFLVALLAGIYQTILTVQIGWFAQQALIAGMGIGTLMYRKQILQMFEVINLGGVANGFDQARRNKAPGTLVGAGAGAIAAGREGGVGAALGGAVRGGMMGSRSPSAMRAGVMGTAAGRRVGGRAERKEREAERRKKAKDPATAAAKVLRDERALDRDEETLGTLYDKDPDHEIFQGRKGRAARERAQAWVLDRNEKAAAAAAAAAAAGTGPATGSGSPVPRPSGSRGGRGGSPGGGSGGGPGGGSGGSGGGPGGTPRPTPPAPPGGGPVPAPAPAAPAGATAEELARHQRDMEDMLRRQQENLDETLTSHLVEQDAAHERQMAEQARQDAHVKSTLDAYTRDSKARAGGPGAAPRPGGTSGTPRPGPPPTPPAPPAPRPRTSTALPTRPAGQPPAGGNRPGRP